MQQRPPAAGQQFCVQFLIHSAFVFVMIRVFYDTLRLRDLLRPTEGNFCVIRFVNLVFVIKSVCVCVCVRVHVCVYN